MAHTDLKKLFSLENIDDESYIDGIRAKISNAYMIVVSILLLPVLAGIFYRTINIGWQSVQIWTFGVFGIWWLVSIFHNYVSHQIRAYVTIASIFLLASSGLVNMGLLGMGIIGYLNCCLLTALFLGVKRSFGLLAICGVATLVIGYGHSTGLFIIQAEPVSFNANVSSWSYVIVLVLTTTASLLFCLAAFTGALVSLLGKVREQGAELMQRHDHLEDMVATRTRELTEEIEIREAREIALKISEERFKGFTELVADRYWETDENLTIIYSPRSYDVIKKYGIKIVGMKPWEVAIGISPDHKHAFKTILEKKQEFHDLKICWILPDGQKLYRRLSGVPLKNRQGKFSGFRVIGIDETAKVAAEGEVQAIQNRFFDALSQFDIGVVLWDPEGKLQFFSTAMKGLYPQWGDIYKVGLSRDKLSEAMWQYASETGETALDKASWIAENHLESGAPSTSSLITRPDGGVSKRFWRCLKDGWVISIHIDASTQSFHEGALVEAKCQAEAANNAKNIFLKSISFELRTPIQAILGFEKLAARDPSQELSEKQQTYLDGIKVSGERLLSLVDSILALTKVEAELEEIDIQGFDNTGDLHALLTAVQRRAAAAEQDDPENSQLI